MRRRNRSRVLRRAALRAAARRAPRRTARAPCHALQLLAEACGAHSRSNRANCRLGREGPRDQAPWLRATRSLRLLLPWSVRPPLAPEAVNVATNPTLLGGSRTRSRATARLSLWWCRCSFFELLRRRLLSFLSRWASGVLIAC